MVRRAQLDPCTELGRGQTQGGLGAVLGAEHLTSATCGVGNVAGDYSGAVKSSGSRLSAKSVPAAEGATCGRAKRR